MAPPTKSELRDSAVSQLARYRVTCVNAAYELDLVMRLAEKAFALPSVPDEIKLSFNFRCSNAIRECKALVEAVDRSIMSQDNSVKLCALSEVRERLVTGLREVQVTAGTLRLVFSSEHARCSGTFSVLYDGNCGSPLDSKNAGFCLSCGATFCAWHTQVAKDIAEENADEDDENPELCCDQCYKLSLKQTGVLQLKPDMAASEMDMRIHQVLTELKRAHERFEEGAKSLIERLRD